MGRQCIDTIDECRTAHQYDCKSYPFIRRVTSVVSTLFLRRLTQVHIDIRLLFQILFRLFQLHETSFCFFRYISFSLLFCQPSFLLCQLSLSLKTVYRNIRIFFFYVRKKSVHIFFMFEITLLFFSVLIYDHKIG